MAKKHASIPASALLTDAQVKRISKPSCKSAWDQSTVAKALALKSISRRAYDFVTDVLKYPLPSASCLSRWIKHFQTPPGILAKSIDLLNASGLLKTEQERLAVLCFDEMALSAQYSDSASSDRVYFPSKNVQVAMVRGLTAKWKQPVYYNFDSSMTKECLLNIILELFKVNYTVVAVVCDQGAKNWALYSSLRLTERDSTFTHPDIPDK